MELPDIDCEALHGSLTRTDRLISLHIYREHLSAFSMAFGNGRISREVGHHRDTCNWKRKVVTKRLLVDYWVKSRATSEIKSSKRKNPLLIAQQGVFKRPAIPTFALVYTIIGSDSLTTVFEKGTGVAFRIWSPERAPRHVCLGALCLDW